MCFLIKTIVALSLFIVGCSSYNLYGAEVKGASFRAELHKLLLKKVSTNVADYMLAGENGTEYWFFNKDSFIDSRNKEIVASTDTTIWKVLNRNYSHDDFGKVLVVSQLRRTEKETLSDTSFYFVKNDTLFQIKTNVVSDEKPIPLIAGPIVKGKTYEKNGAKETIEALNIPIRTPLGDFLTVKLKMSISMSMFSKTVTTSSTIYLAENVLYCKMVNEIVMRDDKTAKKEKRVLTSELFKIVK